MISTNPPQANAAPGAAYRNSIPLYDFPILAGRKPRLLTMPVALRPIRTLRAGQRFAIESFLDEITAESGAVTVHSGCVI